jgi:alpha-tubulin suppressor-like RCC1 family protein
MRHRDTITGPTLRVIALLLTMMAGWLVVGPPAAQAAVASRIATGHIHACAVTGAHGVRCWGRNNFGQLGDGTTTDRSTPRSVKGLSSGVKAISGGGVHTCALTTSGGVKCWGYNGHGQLGDGTTTDRTTPVSVRGLSSGVKAIAAGENYTCALTTGGGVKCWGNNASGQLGDGSNLRRTTPVSVSGLTSGVRAIDAGRLHACAILSADGALRCWGGNNRGQIGDGTQDDRSTPVTVSGLGSGVTAVSAGQELTCAVVGGGVKCWGDTTGSDSPVDVPGLASSVKTVSTAAGYSCVIITGGGVRCWGQNPDGQLGDGTTTSRSTPADAWGLSRSVAAIDTGLEHACALMTAGVVKCWGGNRFGQVGDGTDTDRYTPGNVKGFSGPSSTSASIKAPASKAKGATVKVTGKLTSSDKACTSKRSVTLTYGSKKKSGKTASDGTYSLAFTAPRSSKVVVQVKAATTADCKADSSSKRTVTLK